jgi:hypothetical protein
MAPRVLSSSRFKNAAEYALGGSRRQACPAVVQGRPFALHHCFAFDLPQRVWHNCLSGNQLRSKPTMPLENHLTELQRKHQSLEREIQDALTHPSTDDLKLAELKRRKLLLKDEIAKLKGATSRTVH